KWRRAAAPAFAAALPDHVRHVRQAQIAVSRIAARHLARIAWRRARKLIAIVDGRPAAHRVVVATRCELLLVLAELGICTRSEQNQDAANSPHSPLQQQQAIRRSSSWIESHPDVG